MRNKLANQAVKDELEDLKRGLHIAMAHLIERKNYRDAEDVLRQVDTHLVELIDSIQVVK